MWCVLDSGSRNSGLRPELLGRNDSGKHVAFSRRRAAPELLARQPGALHQRLELRPGDGRMDRHHAGEGAEAAVGAGDHALAADHLREPQDAVADQLGVLDQDRRMGDHPGNQNLVPGEVDGAPDLPFVLVAWILTPRTNTRRP